MKESDEIKLGSVQETLLLPLWGRAVETMKPKPLLVDNKAVAIINSLPYDFTTIAGNISSLSRLSWIARSIFFDNEIKTFINKFPDATIVNIGCGLDTTFDRIDNGTIHWIDLDLPDAIELRKKYFAGTDRRQFAAFSVFDTAWYGLLKNKNNVMLLVAGVLYYFDGDEVKKLLDDIHIHIPGTEVIFDYASGLGVRLSNKVVIERGGMDRSAYLKWGIGNIRDIEKWGDYIKVVGNYPMYKEHKKKYPVWHRIGMSIADGMKVMSLAHIKIS